MEADLFICEGFVIPGGELEVTASRSSGPGGQHVNKTSTRISLRWNLATSAALDADRKRRLAEKLAHRLTIAGELLVHAESNRSQHMNREDARDRLAAMLRAALREAPKRIATRPTRASKRRRLEGKKRRAEVKRARRAPGADD